MALRISHCPMCSAARELATLPVISGEGAGLKLVARDLPVLRCAKNHNAPVHRDFMLWLIQEVRSRESQIEAGREEGMLFKKHLCGACGKDLASKSERRQAYAYELSYEDLAPFKIDIELPVYKCTACGKEQIRSAKELHAHVPAAIVGINDAAGFPHSG
jgi:predicted RNA-binding Zn-ribbon protein involved in translation (DUF1610 family)